MADTIREKILANIKTTLETITVANGYNKTIASVQRWKQSGNALKTVPCIIIGAGHEEYEDRPGFITSCKFSVMLDLWIRHNETVDNMSTDALLNIYLGDIKKALMVDHHRGGYAAATRIQTTVAFEGFEEGAPNAGLIVGVEIEYRHKTTDPTQQ